MKVFITGIKGFIGSHFASELHGLGHSVSGSVFAEDEMLQKPANVDKLILIKLGEIFDASALSEMDVIIHCAHDNRTKRIKQNITGTIAISQAATRKNSPQQIYISSCSALPNAVSEYGKAKYELERYFLQEGHAIIRPGLVIGPGGLFIRMKQAIQVSSVLPLPDGARAPAAIIGICDLTKCVIRIINEKKTGAYNLFNHDIPSLRDVLIEIRKITGSKTLFLPVPSAILFWPLFIAEKIGLNLPINSENLRGYKINRPEGKDSNLHLFIKNETTLSKMIRYAHGFREPLEINS